IQMRRKKRRVVMKIKGREGALFTLLRPPIGAVWVRGGPVVRWSGPAAWCIRGGGTAALRAQRGASDGAPAPILNLFVASRASAPTRPPPHSLSSPPDAIARH